MRSRSRLVTGSAAALTFALACGLLSARVAHAQYGGMPGQPGGGMPAAPMGQEPKEEGPAEAAPEEEGRPSDLEPLGGYAEQSHKKMQIFEIDGYLRQRSDYLYNFALGEHYTTVPNKLPGLMDTNGLPPFPLPLGCTVPAVGTTGTNCGVKGLGSANLRLRLEPTLNITDQVRVHAQIDVLDNTIMGSTPDSLVSTPQAVQTGAAAVPPTSLVYTTQDAPELGQNGYLSSIRAKRAWGEVDSEFGSLRFGRMPWHFGRGITYNDGSCPDCEQGTTVDRLMALTQLYGHQFMLAWDFGSQGITTQQLPLGKNDPNGYPIDLSQDDDVVQLMAAVTKIDPPAHLRERIDRGDLVVNYGLQVVYRSQQNTTAPALMTPPPAGSLPTTVVFGGLAVMPDIWFKLHFRALTVEFEGSAVFGKIDHPAPVAGTAEPQLADTDSRLTMLQLGWVLASELRLYRDSLFVGFETGGATGDSATGNSDSRAQYLNYRWRFVQQQGGDHGINDFKFSPEYHVDEILFRHILGTVTNAIYIKPQIAYWFDLQQSRQLGLTGAAIYSIAQVASGTSGDARSYGVEMDLGVNYRNTAEGFYAGATWGVLWPMAALNRPLYDSSGAARWAAGDALSASAAQVLRAFFGIRF